jgi:hypothetical protein
MADDESLATKRYLLVAPLFERVLAALVDLALFVALAWALRATGDDAAALRIFVRLSPAGALGWIAAILGWSYLSERVTGTTPGKYLLGLVVRSADGSVCTERQIRSRTLWRIADGWPAPSWSATGSGPTHHATPRVPPRRGSWRRSRSYRSPWRWRVSLVRVDRRWLVDAVAVDGAPLTTTC